MTTWNLGDTFTVSIDFLYAYSIDVRYTCQIQYRVASSHTELWSMINCMTSFLPLCTQCWEPRRGLALGGGSEDGAEFWSAAEFRKGGLFVQPFHEAARVFGFRLGTAVRVYGAFTVSVQ